MAGKVIRSVTAKFNADVSDFEKKLNTMSKKLKSTGKDFKTAGETMTKMVTAPIMAAGAAMLALTIKAGSYAESIAIASQTTGMSVKKLQELRYVASQTDVDFETLTGSFGKFTKTLASANDKKSDSAKMFKALGISIKNADGSLRPMNETFFESIKRLGTISDETLQAEMASKLFGKSFQDLIPLIKTSSADLEKYTKRANDLGLIKTDASIQALAAIDDKFAELKMIAENAGNTLAVKFLPVMDKIVKIMETKLIPAASKVIDFVVKMIDKFSALSDKQQDTVLSIIAITAALGPMAIAVGTLVTALGTLAKSAGFAALIKAGPLIAGAVGALAVGGFVASSMTESGNLRKKKTSELSDVQSAGQFAVDLFKGGPDKANKAIEAKNKALAIYQAAQDRVTSAMNKKKELETKNADKALYDYMNGMDKGATKVDTFADSVKSMVDAIKEQTKTFANFVGLFDVFERKSVSGERLLVRLKAQIKAMTEWKTSLASLEKRGISATLLNELRGMGPAAVDSIKALSGLSDVKLKEYSSLYGQKSTMGGEQAAAYVTGTTAAQTKIDKQINIYATGSKGDANEIANVIVKKLRLAGYTI